jgi:hypothetical protein
VTRAAPQASCRQAALKPAVVELRIGHVVWHGPGAPDSRMLESAIEAALMRALAQDDAPVAATAPARAGRQIAGQVLPRLPGG